MQHQILVRITEKGERAVWATKAMAGVCSKAYAYSQRDTIPLPRLLRDLSLGIGFADFRDSIEGLLKKKSTLVSTNGNPGAKGDLEDCFLCGEIEDDDLPWDTQSIDW